MEELFLNSNKCYQNLEVLESDTPNPPSLEFSTSNMNVVPQILNLNNKKNNDPLLNGRQMAMFIPLVFSIPFGYLLTQGNGMDQFWYNFFYLKFGAFTFKVTMPVMYLCIRKDVRNFILRIIHNR